MDLFIVRLHTFGSSQLRGFFSAQKETKLWQNIYPFGPYFAIERKLIMAKYRVPGAKDLFEAGVHFGHQVRRWHPNMEKYIYEAHHDVHVINLEHTENALNEACETLYKITSEGGQVIFVGTKRQVREILIEEANRCGAMHVSERWLGGTLTNLSVIKKKINKLISNRRNKEEGKFDKYTKKERLLIDRETAKLDRSIGGIQNLKKVPEAIFVIDAKREKTAITEAKLLGVKVIALVDTNTNPESVDIVIPGNDDGIKSLRIILHTIADAVEAGYKEYAKKAAKSTEKTDEAKVIGKDKEEKEVADSTKKGDKKVKASDKKKAEKAKIEEK